MGKVNSDLIKFNTPIGLFLCIMDKVIEYVFCICGKCNEKILKFDKYGIERKWKKGHWNKLKNLSGENSPSWKGGKYKSGNGYWLIHKPNHPNCNKDGYIYEHRLVMEKHLGRYLSKTEVVHHIDKNPLNNQIKNLELFETNGKHLKYELVKKKYG
jgi:HNH endonuclease